MAAMPQTADPTGNAPAATGMLTPQKPEGDFSSARLDALFAMKLLDRAISKVGSKSDDGEAMLRARATLTKRFGEQEEETDEFSRAELKRILEHLSGPGEAPKQKPPPATSQQPPPNPQPMAA
jgi:hypothetical protein